MSVEEKFGVTRQQYEALMSFFFEAVVQTEGPEELKEVLELDLESKLASIHIVKEVREAVYPFQLTTLKLASRVDLMKKCVEQISTCSVDMPDVAQDVLLTFKGLVEGGHWQLGMSTLIDTCRDQLEVHRTVRDMPEEEEELEPRYDPIPREKYDPFRHE